jgi:predicted transcriptional regulator
MYAMAKPLNQFREELYLTVDEFAKHLGISLHTLYKVMRGERPRVTTMRRIAEKLGVHPSDVSEFAVRGTKTTLE